MATEVNLIFVLVWIGIMYCPVFSASQPMYSYSGDHMTWKQAKLHCENSSGSLVEFHVRNSKELSYLPNEPVWLGGKSEVKDFTYYWNNHKIPINNIKGTFNSSCLVLNFSSSSEGVKYQTEKCTSQFESRYICRKTVFDVIKSSNIFVSNSSMDWFRAKNKCAEEFDGDLFFLKDGEEISSLDSVLKPNIISHNHLYFVGAHRLVWTWIESSRPFGFAKWENHQPNETAPACVIMNLNRSLDDVPCDRKYRPFCVKHVDHTDTTAWKKKKENNLTLWIGIGVSAGVCLVIIVLLALMCYKKKYFNCCLKKKPKKNPDQFKYINKTLDAQKPSVYSKDPTKINNSNTNDVVCTYESIDDFTPGGSSTSTPSTPDVVMRTHPANQNGVPRKEVYSQVTKKKNNQNMQNTGVGQNTVIQNSDDVNELSDPDSENDDRDIIDNDVYNFY